MIKAAVLVFVGGGVGSLLRLAVSRAARLWLPAEFPWGTLAVNVLGGLAVGAIAGWLLARPAGGSDAVSLFLITGLLGGFTTFSAFSLDTVLLWQRGATAAALIYVAASLLLSLAATVAGLIAVRALG